MLYIQNKYNSNTLFSGLNVTHLSFFDFEIVYTESSTSKLFHIDFYNEVFIFYGRIDNYCELSKMSGKSDIRGILKYLINNYKDNEIGDKIIGSFLIVIIGKDELKIISDYYSFMPIYYNIEKSIKLSTEISLLTKFELDSLNIDKLVEYFSPISIIDESGLDEETTYFKNVYKIPKANYFCYNIIENRIVKKQEYWSPSKKLNQIINYPEISEEFLSIFSEVNNNYISQYKKIGVELSGGIDSSCLISHLSNIQPKDSSIDSFTLTGGTETWEIEQNKINQIIKLYPRLQPHYIEVEPLYDYVEKTNYSFLKSNVQPNVLNLPTALARIFNDSKTNQCEILLSGEGADWFLEGTDYIWDWLYKTNQFGTLFNKINTLINKFGFFKATKYLYLNLLIPLAPKYLNSKYYTKRFYESLVDKSFPDIFTYKFKNLLNEKIKIQTNFFLKNETDFTCWNQRLEFELMFPPNHNWQSLKNENDYILPYLDKRIIEFGLQIPPDKKFMIKKEYKTYYGACKKIQREAFKNIAPNEILDSRIKSTYSMSVSKRFENGMEELKKEKYLILSELGIIDIEKVFGYFKIYQSSKSIDQKYEIEAWLDALLNLENWIKFILKPEKA